MAFNEPRRERADLLLTSPEPQFRASQEGSPRSYTPSSMTTTTFVETNVGAASVGQYVIPEDGDARGQIRQVISFSGTTATVDVAWRSVTGVTRLRAYKPADVPVRTTSAGGTKHAISSDHAAITNEPDSYYGPNKGYFIYGVGGQNAGSASLITGFTNSTGAFTFSTALASTGANELFLVGKPLRPEGPVACTVERNFVRRRVIGYGAPDQAVPVNYKTSSLGFELAQRPLTASAGSAVAATEPLEIGDILRDLFTETKDTGSTATSMSGADLTVGSGTGFTVGGFVLCNTGQVGQVRSKSGNVLTLGTSHVTAASIIASSQAYAAAWYKRKDSDFRTRCFRYWRGGNMLQTLHGAMPTLTLRVSRDEVVRFAFEYSADEALEYDRTRPVAVGATNPFTLVDTTVPVDGKGARCLFNGTAVLLDAFEVDFGFQPKARPSLSGMNQADGMIMDLAPVSGRLRIYADENDLSGFEDVQDLASRGQPFDFVYQKGTAAQETFALAVPALQISPSKFEINDTQGLFACEWEAVLPQAVRGNSFNSALPAFAFGWL